MWFVFDVYERDLAWLRMGQIVDVSTAAVPGKVFSAPITFIDPNLMNETRSVKIRVVLENPLGPAQLHDPSLNGSGLNTTSSPTCMVATVVFSPTLEFSKMRGITLVGVQV